MAGSLVWAESVLAEFGAQADLIREQIRHADVTAVSPDLRIRRRSALLRATAYVLRSAALERAVREAINGLLESLTGLGISCRNLRLTLFALVEGAEFDRLQNVRGLATWQSRARLLNAVAGAAPAVFNASVRPLDGHTLRRDHFDTLWQVFGLPGSSLPSPLHSAALEDLREGRNAIAHGDEDAERFGRSKNARDLENLIDRVEQVAEHLLLAMEEYLARRCYERIAVCCAPARSREVAAGSA